MLVAAGQIFSVKMREGKGRLDLLTVSGIPDEASRCVFALSLVVLLA